MFPRRLFLCFPLLLRATAPAAVRGKLQVGAKPVLTLGDGRQIALTGDEPTMGVLADDRLQGADFEAMGQPKGESTFEIAPMHTRAIFVHQGDKRLLVTYWCDVCYIRTYTPGKCWCCQKDTDLDLRESLADSR